MCAFGGEIEVIVDTYTQYNIITIIIINALKAVTDIEAYYIVISI